MGTCDMTECGRSWTRSESFKPRPDTEVASKEAVAHEYTGNLISLEEMAYQIKGLSIYNLSPLIDSTPAYATRRREFVTKRLEGGAHVPPEEKATQHKDFRGETTRNLAFLSVDICGATAYRRRDAQGFDKAYAYIHAGTWRPCWTISRFDSENNRRVVSLLMSISFL